MFFLNAPLQFGIIKCALKITEIYNPVNYCYIWSEFNFLEVSLSLLNQNFATGTDLSCQCDLIRICTKLIAGKI